MLKSSFSSSLENNPLCCLSPLSFDLWITSKVDTKHELCCGVSKCQTGVFYAGKMRKRWITHWCIVPSLGMFGHPSFRVLVLSGLCLPRCGTRLNVGAHQIRLPKERLFGGCCFLRLFGPARNSSIFEDKEASREAVVLSIKAYLYHWASVMGEFRGTRFDDFVFRWDPIGLSYNVRVFSLW